MRRSQGPALSCGAASDGAPARSTAPPQAASRDAAAITAKIARFVIAQDHDGGAEQTSGSSTSARRPACCWKPDRFDTTRDRTARMFARFLALRSLLLFPILGCGGSTTPCTGTACASDSAAPIVLFSGSYLTDTWTWDGARWTPHATPGPTGRYLPAAARLGASVLVFGGVDSDQKLLSDTWLWDGNAWTQVSTGGPSARSGASTGALDGKIVLFGGTDSSLNALGDTWEWNGSTWTAHVVTVSPPAEAEGCMVALNGKVVLFTGGTGETWEWDGNTWTQKATTGPSGRYGAACAPLNGKLVLFGGTLGPAFFQDTWLWDGSAWSKANPSQPPPARFRASAGSLDGTMLLFGGTTATMELGDTWLWNGSDWESASPSPAPPSRSGGAMVGP